MASRQQCQRALAIHENMLCKISCVAGLGIVKLDDPLLGSKTNYAIGVYLKSLPQKKQVGIPEFLEINGRGKTIVRIPVKTLCQGEVDIERNLEIDILPFWSKQ